MIADENMESWMRSLVNTYFEKVKERVHEGKGIVEIINENLADNAELMVQVDMIREQTNKENYWENITRIAELAKQYGNDKGNDFYGRVYDYIVEITQECFEDGKVYTLDDLNEFRVKMQRVYDTAGMPQYMMEIGKTPDKMFLLAATAHAREGEADFTKQMMGLLQLVKDGELNLGNATNDLEDFCVQIGNAYEELKVSGTEEQMREFQELFLHDFMHTDKLKATNIKIRKSKLKIEKNNAYLTAVQDDILADPEFYTRIEQDENGQEISNLEKMIKMYPGKFLGEIKRNRAFLKMFAAQVLGDKAEELDDYFNLEDIKQKMIGKQGYTLEDIYTFDYSEFNDIVPLILKQEARDVLEESVAKTKVRPGFSFETTRTAKTIMEFANIGEIEFAGEQASNLFRKIEERYSTNIPISDKYQIALAMIMLNSITKDGVTFEKSNPEIFEDAVNGLKQHASKDEFQIQLVRDELLKLAERNPEALRVLEFVESDEVKEYSQMEPKNVLTPEIMQAMARNPEVQECIPGAGELIERVAEVEKEQVEH